MSLLEKLDGLTTSEYAQFQRICRKLLKMTFIVREKSEEQKRDFYFAVKHQELIRSYFQIIGYDITAEETSGVVMLVNRVSAGEEGAIQSNRRKLRLQESIVLCCLWLLFADRMSSGSLTRAIIIEKAELDFQLEKFGYKNRIEKKAMEDILKLFSDFNLIEVIGKVGESDCKIKLYPSLQFCLSDTEFQKFTELTASKMQERRSKAMSENDAEALTDEEEDDE